MFSWISTWLHLKGYTCCDRSSRSSANFALHLRASSSELEVVEVAMVPLLVLGSRLMTGMVEVDGEVELEDRGAARRLLRVVVGGGLEAAFSNPGSDPWHNGQWFDSFESTFLVECQAAKSDRMIGEYLHARSNILWMIFLTRVREKLCYPVHGCFLFII